jgi:hypothetical protein
MAAAEREFCLALMQATGACKLQYRSCAGGKYDRAAAARRARPALQRRRDESPRRSGGLCSRHPMPARQADGVCQHQLPADRADAGEHLDDLRRWPGPRVAADHSHGRQPAFAAPHPPIVRRFARPPGGKYARHRVVTSPGFGTAGQRLRPQATSVKNPRNFHSTPTTGNARMPKRLRPRAATGRAPSPGRPDVTVLGAARKQGTNDASNRNRPWPNDQSRAAYCR